MNLDEAKQLYADRMFTRFLPMIPVPDTSKLTDAKAQEAQAQYQKIIDLVRKSCWDSANDLFEVLKLVAISVQVDTIAEQAATIEGAVAASGAVTGDVQTTAKVSLPLTGRTKTASNSDGSYDLDPDYQGLTATRQTTTIPAGGFALTAGSQPFVPGEYPLEAVPDGSGWYFYWNAIQSARQASWPASKLIVIDGGAAGRIAFTAAAAPPVGQATDTVLVARVTTSANGSVNAAGSVQNGQANTTGSITEGSATLTKLIMTGTVKFHQAPVYLLTRQTNYASAQDLSVAKGSQEIAAGSYSLVLKETTIYDGSRRYSWSWNNVEGPLFKIEEWPAGIVSLDGGVAGVLTFSPSPKPPLSGFNQVDTVVITVANAEVPNA